MTALGWYCAGCASGFLGCLHRFYKGVAVSRSHDLWVKAQATIDATDTARRRTLRRTAAKKLLRGLTFVPEQPFRVETFEGGIISPEGRRNHATDLHLVDARGRTIKVYTYTGSGKTTLGQRRARAQWHADELNAL